MQDLSGWRVLVTGGARRLGGAMARRLARGGAAVAVHYHRSEAEARELVAELATLSPGPHLAVPADLRSPQAVEALLPALIGRGFRPNALVNNASVYRRQPLAAATDASVAEDYQVNFFAPFALMRAFQRLAETGCIINLLDQRVAQADPGAGVYALAKKSLRDATEAAALEWAPAVRVNGIAPGLVLPPPGVAPDKMARLLEQVPLRRAVGVAEIAEAAAFLLASPAATGLILYLDGGLHLVPPLPEKAGAPEP
ncbi:MAG: SDR family oxidoreductase [Lentisphaeria bacterium]